MEFEIHAICYRFCFLSDVSRAPSTHPSSVQFNGSAQSEFFDKLTREYSKGSTPTSRQLGFLKTQKQRNKTRRRILEGTMSRLSDAAKTKFNGVG